MAAKKRKNIEIELTPELIAEVIYKANKPVKLDDILTMLKVRRQRKRDVEFLLHALELDGRLIRSRGTWFPPKNRPLVQGMLSIQRSGAGFVIPEEKGAGDIFIAPQDLLDAWDGDTVEVVIMPHRQGPSREGRITRIIEKSQKMVPAFALRQQGDDWIATPQHPSLQVVFKVDVGEIASRAMTPVQPTYGGEVEIYTPPPVQADDLLLILPLEKIAPGIWSAKGVMNLYSEESPAAQELLAKMAHGIPMEFPPAVIQEAADMPEDPAVEEALAGGRKDLRDMGFVTIDGADAKDFDDAIYVEKSGEGYRLLVAIADVSHYVEDGSAIDNEARRRGNSYYFPLSVEPMLPEVLSNGLCSLKPNTPRLGVVADMVFSAKGVEKSARFYTAVIESKARLTYDQVYTAIIDDDADMQKKMASHVPMLQMAFALAGVLSKQRTGRGSLDFELPEAHFVFDEKGDVASIVARTSTKANNLIEECMIAANESVARALTARNTALLYRIHEAPNMEKLEALKNFLLQTQLIELPAGLQGAGGVSGKGSRHGFTSRKQAEPTPPTPQEFKAILQAARGTPQEYTVNRLLLRAMMQAKYSPDNEGHFGLASQCYCHFTSPIRRYADLIVHRVLKNTLAKESGGVSVGHKKQGNRAEMVPSLAGREGINDSVEKRQDTPQQVWPREKRFAGDEAYTTVRGTGQGRGKGSYRDKNSHGTPRSRGQDGLELVLGSYPVQRLEQIAEHINQTERSAMDAERETHKRLSALYLREHIGETFEGIISGVTDFGMFVELTSCLSEGMIRLSTLNDDFYHYLPERQMLRGERTGRIFAIGQAINVILADVSLQRYEVTLELCDEDGNVEGKGRRFASKQTRNGRASPKKTAGNRDKRTGKKNTESGNGRSKKSVGSSKGSSTPKTQKPARKNSRKTLGTNSMSKNGEIKKGGRKKP